MDLLATVVLQDLIWMAEDASNEHPVKLRITGEYLDRVRAALTELEAM